MTSSAGERPYLDDQVQFTQTDTLIQWAKYLGTTFGTGGALCALRYYERLNWITESARRDVERQIEGLSLEELHSKKYDEPGMLSGPLSGLSGTPFGAHAKSLEFIARIAGDDLEADMLRTRLAQHRADIDLAAEADASAVTDN